MHKFLIVDDDPAGLRLLKVFLAPYGQCDLTDNGEQAIAMFCQALETGSGYDLVCLDIMMPGLDGHAVLQSLRHLETERGILGSSGVKVLMLSATNDAKHCIRAFNEGCEAYIAKPLRKHRLLTEVRSLLGELDSVTETSSPPADISRRGRYLIVDDEPTHRRLLAFLLAPYADCDQANNGETAVMLFRDAIESERRYDLVCLDTEMLGFDGYSVLRIVRRMETDYGVGGDDSARILMVSSADEPKGDVPAFDKGREAYLAWPFEPDDLFNRLSHLGVLPQVESTR